MQGLDGRDGLPGEPGLDGIPGRSGIDGHPGRDGIPGTPGTHGKAGQNGKNGEKGKKNVVFLLLLPANSFKFSLPKRGQDRVLATLNLAASLGLAAT